MRKKLLFLCLALWAAVGVRAAQVDTVLVHSSSMNKDIKVIAVCPDRMKTGERCPVFICCMDVVMMKQNGFR